MRPPVERLWSRLVPAGMISLARTYLKAVAVMIVGGGPCSLAVAGAHPGQHLGLKISITDVEVTYDILMSAELRKYVLVGAELVGNSLVPEAFLAKELQLCYAGLAYVRHRALDCLEVGLRYDYEFLLLGGEDYLSRHALMPYVSLLENDRGRTTAYYVYEPRRFF